MKNNYKFWIVFSLITVFAAGAIGGILSQKHIIEKKQDFPERRRSSVRFPTLGNMAQELNLTAEQQEKIREAFKNNEERFQSLRSEIQERLSDMRSQLKSEIENILTQEQSQKFEAMIERYTNQRKKEMGERKKHITKKEIPELSS